MEAALSSFTKSFDKFSEGTIRAKAFHDFLSITIFRFTINPATGYSLYSDEKEYRQIATPYKKNGNMEHVCDLILQLIDHANNCKERGDLLSDFYEQVVCHGKRGYMFADFQTEIMMADIILPEDSRYENAFDPACRTGRFLSAIGQKSENIRLFYGMECNPFFVMACAINIFLSGHSGEILCGNIYVPDDFNRGYRISQNPHGIFRIGNKNDSVLWKMVESTFRENVIANCRKPRISYFLF